MNKNAFLKSVLRQPIRAFILTILVGAAAFALVARVTEFAIVRAGITRIEAVYRAIGVLSPMYTYNVTSSHDVNRVLDIVESHPRVVTSDARRFVQGVLEDRRNLVFRQVGGFFNPGINDLDIPLMDHYFIGYIPWAPSLMRDASGYMLVVTVNVQELITGDLAIMRDTERVIQTTHGNQVALVLRTRQNIRLYITDEEAEAFRSRTWNPFESLGVGEDAMAVFRATPQWVHVVIGDPWSGMVWFLRGVDGNDGLTLDFSHNPRTGGGYVPRFNVERGWDDDVPFFIPLDDTAAIADLYEAFALINQNQASVIVTETVDMTAIPRFADRRVTQLAESVRFPGGRFLTAEDYGRPVAVVPVPMATRQGLQVGETFTITLYDNPHPAWINRDTQSVWSRGIEGWWDTLPQAWWAMAEGANTQWRERPSITLELEVVGTYWMDDNRINNFTLSEIFIPAGVIPAGFGWQDVPLLTGSYSFVLDTPRSEEAFLRQTRAALAEAGFVASFMPNGFETLAAATNPIRFSIMINLIIFGAASVLVLVFIVFIYMRQWRTSVAIAQALGTPRRRVLRRLFAPVVILWLPALAAGTVGAWFFAHEQAERALAGLTNDAELFLVLPWLLVFGLALAAFVLLGIAVTGYATVRRPVLEQLQGGMQKPQKLAFVDAGVVPEGFAAGQVDVTPLPRNPRSRLRTFIRHRMRYICRTPMKTMLLIGLSAILVFSLGWLHRLVTFTETEIERLWNETVISGELRRFAGDDIDALPWPAFISPESWAAINHSGFVQSAYLEALGLEDILGVSDLAAFIDENTKTFIDEQLGVACEDLTITFLPGFAMEDFAYIPGEPVPLLLRADVAAIWEEEFDWTMTDDAWQYTSSHYARWIGTYEGGLARAVNRSASVQFIAPLDAVRSIFTGWSMFYGWGSIHTYHPPYWTARFTLDPAHNRELNRFREAVAGTLVENNIGGASIPLQLLMNDYVLYDVIIPMEQTLSLLRVLYPIAIGVALLLAVGLPLLIMLQSAKNAAIMRILGTRKTAAQNALWIEQVSVCIMGAVLGMAALFIAGGAWVPMSLLLAGVYVTGAFAGSLAGAVIISTHPPLELLQVRE